jgi:molybdate transport system regulatory protein
MEPQVRRIVRIAVPLGDVYAMGPGKADLLEAIHETGSISAAGRKLGMSYRRAWLLVDEMNHCFQAPLVEARLGGSGGGGAKVTELGHEVVKRYRALQVLAWEGIRERFQELQELLKPAAPGPR